MEKIKSVIKKYFNREATDEECKEISDELERMNPSFKINQSTEILFSPNQILKEFNSAQERDPQSLESNKYKHLREMLMAALFAWFIKKQNGTEWYIRGDDAPDIYLTQPNGTNWPEESMGARLEILFIVQQDVVNWKEEEIEKNIADFIKTKKFDLRLERPVELLVYLNFHSTRKLVLQKIKESLTEFTNIPFDQIYVILGSTGLDQFTVAKVYPTYLENEVDQDKDNDLLF